MTTRPSVVEPLETTAQVTFDKTMEDRIAELLRRYPTRRAALLPVLWLCQERYGWISPAVISAVAERLERARGATRKRLHELTLPSQSPDETLALRVEVTRLALRASQLALLAAKGSGFVAPHPAQRWARQALFFLVWSCPQPVASAALREFAGCSI